MRRFFHHLAYTVYFVRRWLATPKAERFTPGTQLLKSPICWVRGHSWDRRPSFGISSWVLEHCTCCGQEIAYRTSLSCLKAPETDDEVDQAAWEREYEDRTSYGDDFRDHDGAYADWDAMRDEAAANGGSF